MLRLSPSRIGDFKICPQLFKYRAIDRLPEPPSLAATRGSIVHLALENLYALPAQERQLDTAIEILHEAWSSYIDADMGEALFESEDHKAKVEAASERYIQNYFQLETPTKIDPVGREIRLQAEIGGVNIVGILDRLDRSEDGTWIISDYKTGSTPEIDRSTSAFFAMRIYAVLFYNIFGTLPAQLRLLYLDAPESYVLEIAQRDAQSTTQIVKAISSAIARSVEKNDWRARRSGFCRICSFKGICPAWAEENRVEDHVGITTPTSRNR